jgi:hypothetical protein
LISAASPKKEAYFIYKKEGKEGRCGPPPELLVSGGRADLITDQGKVQWLWYLSAASRLPGSLKTLNLNNLRK